MFKHAKVTTITPQEDGTVEISAESYYEQLAHVLVEIEKRIPTSRQTILTEIINCLELITKEKSPKLVITIEAKNGEPMNLIKRWTTVKESFNRW